MTTSLPIFSQSLPAAPAPDGLLFLRLAFRPLTLGAVMLAALIVGFLVTAGKGWMGLQTPRGLTFVVTRFGALGSGATRLGVHLHRCACARSGCYWRSDHWQGDAYRLRSHWANIDGGLATVSALVVCLWIGDLRSSLECCIPDFSDQVHTLARARTC